MVEEQKTNEFVEEIKPEHKRVLNQIRAAYVNAGAKLSETPEQFGLNERHKSYDGTLQLSFDYGTPHYLYTADGTYVVAGSHLRGDYEEFMGNLRKEFDVEIIKPQRDDSKVSRLEYQLQASGPLVRLTPKEEK